MLPIGELIVSLFLFQPIIIRTDTEERPSSSSSSVGGVGGARGRGNFGSANKTTISGQLLGSKERSLKPTSRQQQHQQTPNTAILTDEEGDIDLLVEIAGPSASTTLDEDAVEDAFTADFQRLKSVGSRGGGGSSNSTASKARFV